MLKNLIMKATLVALLGSISFAAHAVADTQRIEIPAGELVAALESLARQAEVDLVYSDAQVRGLKTAGVSGEFSAQEAIAKLLEGTPLEVRADEVSGALLIAPPSVGPAATSQPAKAGIEAPSAKEASNQHSEKAEGVQKKSFWDRFRVAQVDQRKTADNGPIEKSVTPENGELEEIVVTAQKRIERLIDTPQSVSVLSADSLAKLGATQFRDFANTVPGLSFNTSGAGETQVSLRGVTSGFDISPTVGIYVDEVPYGSSSAFTKANAHALDVGLFDIDRIEVLRGPQGTLYGASTMGGLVKYVSKRPSTTKFGVDAQVGTSSTKDGEASYTGAAAINLPLVADKVAMRVSGFYNHDGGYIDNLARGEKDVNGAGIYGGRADLLFTPSDALSIRINAFAQNISRDAPAAADYALNGGPVDGELDQRHAFAEPFFQRFRLASGTVNYDFGPATLTSISSYQEARARFTYDITTFIGPALEFFLGRTYGAISVNNDQGVDKFTQELRLASNGSRELEWLVGAYYTRETGSNFQDFGLRDLNGDPFPPNDLFTFSRPSKFKETAGFADVTYFDCVNKNMILSALLHPLQEAGHERKHREAV